MNGDMGVSGIDGSRTRGLERGGVLARMIAVAAAARGMKKCLRHCGRAGDTRKNQREHACFAPSSTNTSIHEETGVSDIVFIYSTPPRG